MVSKFIGIKVLLNYICQIFNLPPTKTQLFYVISDQTGNKDIQKLETRGTITSRLVDLKMEDETQIVVHSVMPEES